MDGFARSARERNGKFPPGGHVKRIFAPVAVILAALVFTYFAYMRFMHDPAPAKPPGIASIRSYNDIPNVTPDEIAAVEALKTRRERFTYGALLATEMFVRPDGTHAGFTPKVCELLTDLFGIPFVPEIHEWDALIEGLDARTIDFTGELTPTEERIQKYSMTHPVAVRMLRIFTRKDGRDFRTEADLEQLTIGFLEGATTEETIRNVYPTVSFRSVEVNDYEAAVRMLESREIDVFVEEATADPAFDEFDGIRSQLFFLLINEPVAMTTANHELAPVISVVNKYIEAGGFNHLYELYREGEFEYARHKLRKSFTDEERAWLEALKRDGGTVVVGYEKDNYPITFFNEREGELQGVAVDVLAEIGQLADIRFEPSSPTGAAWADIYEEVKTGKIPMFLQLLKTEERKEYFIWSTAPYARTFYAILSRAEHPNLASYQVMRTPVAVMALSGYLDTYQTLFAESGNLRKYATEDDCLNALEKGEVDLLMASEYSLLTLVNYHEKPGFKINLRLHVPMDSHFGFHKDETVLRSIIDKAQAFIPVEPIEMEWMGRAFDYSKKLSAERAHSMTRFAGVVSVLLVISAFLLVRTVTLSRKLKNLASKDALTGILNRRAFMENGVNHIGRTHRIGRECYVAIFDLDHFKSVNDKYGHLAGDQVLREAAARVKGVIRPYDLFGRYGGEEFILLMFDIDRPGVARSAERIRLALCETPVVFEGQEIPVSASFGVSSVTPMIPIGKATQFADEALYRAKEGGRNRVEFAGELGAGGTRWIVRDKPASEAE